MPGTQEALQAYLLLQLFSFITDSTLSQLHDTIFLILFLLPGCLFLILLPGLIFLELPLNTGVLQEFCSYTFSCLI